MNKKYTILLIILLFLLTACREPSLSKEDIKGQEAKNINKGYGDLKGFFEGEKISSVFKHSFENNDLAIVSVEEKEKENELVNYFIIMGDEKDNIKKYKIPDNSSLSYMGVEEVKDGYILVLQSEDENKIFIRTFLALSGEDIKAISIDSWLRENSDENVHLDNNEIYFSKSDIYDFYDGPIAVPMRIDVDGKRGYSIVVSYYDEDSKTDKAYKIFLCDEDSESYLIRNYYFKDLYRSKNIDYFDEDLNPNMFQDDLVINKIIENIDKLDSKYWKIPLPSNYMIISYDTGDLNSDGEKDYSITVEHLPGYSSYDRQTYVLISDGDKEFKVIKDNNNLAFGAAEGGVFGDPFTGVSIDEGSLSIRNYGGSSDRWAYEYKFSFLDSKLQLVESREIYHSSHTGCGTETVNDYLKSNSEVYSYSYEEEYDDLLLSSESIDNTSEIYFDEISLDESYKFYYSDREREPLPDLYRIPYGQVYWNGNLRKSSEEILDYVAKTMYPDLIKTDFSYPEDILSNYSSLLSHEIARHYYKSSDKKLWYDGIDMFEDDMIIFRVLYKDKEKNIKREISVYVDDDGNIIKK